MIAEQPLEPYHTFLQSKRSSLQAAQKNLERALREKGQASLWGDEPEAEMNDWKEAVS